jgi:diaminohydroxyphosphoribosylaminopyrimidine deaminase/5-amino-6-(5-phosphoribosylamino)uracil reductase
LTQVQRVGPFLAENDDAAWMRLALALAERGRGWVEPNPLVGAVIVREGRQVAAGYHERFGGPHAEVVALRAAGADANGSTLYVTLEPCCHFGKTPPCTDAILEAGIARVVAAMDDPFPDVSGRGAARLRAAGISVEIGCEADAARRLNAPYLKRLAVGLPLVTAKWAMTLDGKSATSSGDSRWISSEESRRQVHELRGRTDAIIAGIGTVEADDPLLTARPSGPRAAARVVLDSAARLAVSSRLARTAREHPVIVAVSERARPERRAALVELGCEVVGFSGQGRVPVTPLLEELGRRGMTNVLLEGGGSVLGSFLDEGQVDSLDVFIAPLLEGGDRARTPARGRGCALMSEAGRLRDVEMTQVGGPGGDVRVRGWLRQAWRAQAGFGDR